MRGGELESFRPPACVTSLSCDGDLSTPLSSFPLLSSALSRENEKKGVARTCVRECVQVCVCCARGETKRNEGNPRHT